jgi:hypothetical protein
MVKLYNILRVVAYITGLVGMVLFMTARQSAEPQATRATAGGILLITSFICFLGTYAIYMVVRLGKRR